jgi:uncharacterized protein (TIGR02117 family)
MELTKKILKKVFKYTLWFLATIIAFVGTWLLCALLLPKIKMNSDRKKQESGVEIFVKSNGVHTDLILPVKNKLLKWDSLLQPNTFEEVDTTFEYVAFGWGDKGFYLDTPTWADLKFSTAFKAAFWLGEAAMHVTYYKTAPGLSDRCRKIILSTEEYKKLISYIRNSFDQKEGRYLLIDHPGYSNQDNFYEGKGTYNFCKTCNEWTGDGLEECGVKIGIWTPLQGAIIDEIE